MSLPVRKWVCYIARISSQGLCLWSLKEVRFVVFFGFLLVTPGSRPPTNLKVSLSVMLDIIKNFAQIPRDLEHQMGELVNSPQNTVTMQVEWHSYFNNLPLVPFMPIFPSGNCFSFHDAIITFWRRFSFYFFLIYDHVTVKILSPLENLCTFYFFWGRHTILHTQH